MENLFENNGAEFSECKKYRYKLWRIWDETKPIAMVIGLNPSTANADKPDPTISILKRMLTKLGYGGFYMMNLFTIISSKPGILKGEIYKDIFDWQNCLEILIEVGHRKTVIFGWGDFKEAKERGEEIKRVFPNAFCFGKSKSGAPLHPLALMYNGTQGNPKLIKFN